MRPPLPFDHVQIARRLLAARRDLLPERELLDDFEKIAASAFALRELGVQTRPVARAMTKRNGCKYVGHALQIQSMVLSMDGYEGWDAIATAVMELSPGQGFTMFPEHDRERYLFSDMSTEELPVFRSAVASDVAWLQASILEDGTPASEQERSGLRL